MKKARVVHWLLWVYDQMPWLHQLSWTKRWGDRLTGLVRLLRRQPVCILVKTDEVRLPSLHPSAALPGTMSRPRIVEAAARRPARRIWVHLI